MELDKMFVCEAYRQRGAKKYLYLYLNLFINIYVYIFFTVCVYTI